MVRSALLALSMIAAANARAGAAAVAVDLTQYSPVTGVKIEPRRGGAGLRASWSGPDGKRMTATFNLVSGQPLLSALEVGGATLARDVRPVFVVTVGSRTEKPGERYIFFDKPASRPTETHTATLDLARVAVRSTGKRVSLGFSTLRAGPFSGDLVVSIYAGSPLLHIEAAMSPGEKTVAYIYDAVLEGDFKHIVWKDLGDKLVREAPGPERVPVAVRHRAIMAESGKGTLAVFPPPHAFFFPRDYADNFKFAQLGRRGFGLRQDPAGGPGHKGAYIPWFDAPAGRTQRMGMFLLPSATKAEDTLERVKRYTNGDAFKPMPDRVTFSSHWHAALAAHELAGKPRAEEFVRVLKAMNVNIVHLAEFHGDGHPQDAGAVRLGELKTMFDVCRKNSDDRLLLLPGEEANALLNKPPPANQHAGHWVYLFPKPVYLTLHRPAGAPFVESIAPYGTVYHPGTEAEMIDVLGREGALAWTAHPRIKASFATPDAYRERAWFRGPVWLGAAWKAMPADLSEARLGARVLDLLDDMNTWSQHKQILGEVDVFDIDATSELWGHMNVNYLRLPRVPTFDDWSPVLDVLRRGDFFVTTGEVLIHAFEVKAARAAQTTTVRAELEWTFPLSQVSVIVGDGKQTRRHAIALPETTEFGRATFEWPVDLAGARWVRLEAWDVAMDTAFTQPLGL